MSVGEHPENQMSTCFSENKAILSTEECKISARKQCLQVKAHLQAALRHPLSSGALVYVSLLIANGNAKQHQVLSSLHVRRHGHNEMDDPRATMPLTYAAIDTHPRVLKLYSDTLSARFPQQPSEGVARTVNSDLRLEKADFGIFGLSIKLNALSRFQSSKTYFN
jgi:hypothetical protein